MGKIRINQIAIKGLYVIEPEVYIGERGCFSETYNQKEMDEVGLNMRFVQDNQSMSVKGVLRGLHVQKQHPQGKLIRVVQGAIFDVAVDMRKNSETYGQWFGIELSEKNNKQFYISEGFAHGFYVISDIAILCYKVTEYWYPNDEIGIPWNDKDLNISWPIPYGTEPIIAEKDKNYTPFKEIIL